MEQSLERLDSEAQAVEDQRKAHRRLLAQIQGSAPEVVAVQAEPMSPTGVFVYEVIAEEAVVVRSKIAKSEYRARTA